MGGRKLTYRFCDPNPASVTAAYILEVMIEVNGKKVERAIRMAAGRPRMEETEEESRPDRKKA